MKAVVTSIEESKISDIWRFSSENVLFGKSHYLYAIFS
jgi:hypothetical protein